jgi:hypothetical protein
MPWGVLNLGGQDCCTPASCGTWTVTYLDPCSEPIEGLAVTLTRGGATVDTGVTDSSGVVALDFTTTGSHTLTATYGECFSKVTTQFLTCGTSPTTTITLGATELYAALPESLTLTTPYHTITLAYDSFWGFHIGTGTASGDGVASSTNCNSGPVEAITITIRYVLTVSGNHVLLSGSGIGCQDGTTYAAYLFPGTPAQGEPGPILFSAEFCPVPSDCDSLDRDLASVPNSGYTHGDPYPYGDETVVTLTL